MGAGDQRGAEGAHDPGDVRADDLNPGDLFKRPEHGPVIEGAALHDDVGAELRGVGELDDLVEGVLDDRIGEASRDVPDGSAFLLGLLDVGVHEHGAARAEIHGVFGKERFPGEALRGIAEGVGKVFQEGPAAGAAGLVEQDVVDRAVTEADALHVLAANVQHAVDLRVKEGGGGAVGDGLDLALVEVEGGLEKLLPVAGGAGAHDMRVLRKAGKELAHGAHRRADRVAVVVRIEGEEKLPVLPDEGELGGGGSGVDAEEAVAAGAPELPLRDDGPGVPGTEFVIARLGGEERRKPLEFKRGLNAAAQPVDQDADLHRFGRGRAGNRPRPELQRGALGGEEMRIRRVDDLLRRQAQRADERLFELRKEMQRAAEKGDVAADRTAAGEPGDGLVDHGLKDGGGKIGGRRALVDERLDVGLGEDAAAGRDGIDLGRLSGGAVEALGVGLEQGGHLVDEGSGAAGADAVHALLRRAGEVDDLGVLAAELDGDVRPGKARAQRRGDGDDLLHEGDLQRAGETQRAGAGNPGEKQAVADLLPGVGEQIGQRLAGMRAVTPVFFIDAASGFVQKHELDGGGADVDAGMAELHE